MAADAYLFDDLAFSGCFCDLKHKLPAVMTSIADDDFNTGYNFEFTDNSIRLGKIPLLFSYELANLIITLSDSLYVQCYQSL